MSVQRKRYNLLGYFYLSYIVGTVVFKSGKRRIIDAVASLNS